MKVEWSADAIADLGRFAHFLQHRLPKIARLLGDEITQKTDLLTEHPELGRALARRPDLRQIVIRVLNASYVIHYRLMPDRLVILRVFHGREARDL